MSLTDEQKEKLYKAIEKYIDGVYRWSEGKWKEVGARELELEDFKAIFKLIMKYRRSPTLHTPEFIEAFFRGKWFLSGRTIWGDILITDGGVYETDYNPYTRETVYLKDGEVVGVF